MKKLQVQLVCNTDAGRLGLTNSLLSALGMKPKSGTTHLQALVGSKVMVVIAKGAAKEEVVRSLELTLEDLKLTEVI